MSASDDYHRHRLRTATKYFKVSVKPFQRLGRERGGSPEKRCLAGCGAAAPKMAVGEKRRTSGHIYVTMVEINIFNTVIFQE